MKPKFDCEYNLIVPLPKAVEALKRVSKEIATRGFNPLELERSIRVMHYLYDHRD